MQLDDLVRLHEAPHLQQLTHYGSNRPVVHNIPTASLIQPPFARSVTTSYPADIFDLTVDDEDDADDMMETKGDGSKQMDNGHFITSAKEDEPVLSRTVSRKRKIGKVGSSSNVMRRDEVSKPHDATASARGIAPKSPLIDRRPPDFLSPKCVTSKDIALIAQALLDEIDTDGAAEASILQGPLENTQLAMQAYMKATVNAFDRLQQTKDDDYFRR